MGGRSKTAPRAGRARAGQHGNPLPRNVPSHSPQKKLTGLRGGTVNHSGYAHAKKMSGERGATFQTQHIEALHHVVQDQGFSPLQLGKALSAFPGAGTPSPSMEPGAATPPPVGALARRVKSSRELA